MKKSQDAQHKALLFLYNLALEISREPEKIYNLQQIFEQYILDQKDHFPFITLNAYDYYSQVNTKLLKLKDKPSLHSVLVDLFNTYPPVEGGMTGDHISYDQVTKHENMVALIGRFADCYDLTE